MAINRKIEIDIIGDDQLTRPLNKAEKAIGGIEKESKKAAKGFGALDVAVGSIAGNLATMGIEAALGAVTDTIGQTVDASDALQKSLAFDDLDSTAIQGMSEDLIYLQDAFGIDMQQSINASDRVMTQFGVSATEAMDAMRMGADMNLDRFGDLGDTLNEYSQDFANVGFSAQNTMAIINAGLEAGARDTDAIGDAWNEFGIRIKDPAILDSIGDVSSDMEQLVHLFQSGDLTEAEAFTAIRDQLLAIEDPIERNAAGVALFGTKWEDMGADAMLAMLQTSQALDDGTLSAEGMANSQMTLQQSIASVKASIQGAFVPALTELMATMAPIIAEYAPKIAEWLGTNIPAAIAATQGAIEFLNPIIDLMIAGFDIAISTIEVLISILDAIIGVFVNVVAAVQGVVTPVEAATNVLNDMATPIRKLISLFGQMVSAIGRVASKLTGLKPPKWLSKIGGGVKNKVGGILGFAAGGNYPANEPFVVGERGPEMILPNGRSGAVVPNNKLSSAGAGGNTTITVPITVQGSMDEKVLATVEGRIHATLDRLIQGKTF